MDTLGFLAKKIISTFIYPLGFSLAFIVVGLLLRRLVSRSRTGGLLVVLGVVLLTVFSFPITGYLLLHPLEVEAGSYADPVELRAKDVRYIVVLAGEWVKPDLTPADRLGASIFRVLEGVRLWQGCPESKIVFSGGSMPGRVSDTEALAVLPMQMGVPKEAMILDNRAWDTEDEARIFSELIGKKPFALVSSARHLPRATDLFRSRGLNPIPCPCDFQTRRPPAPFQWFLPSAHALVMSTSAVHERVGRLWYELKP